MEHISLKREYLDRKLEKETSNLDKLKLSLKTSSEQTNSMLTVLDKFQERLHKLGQMILPVYEETQNYQTRQDNIDKTLSAIDKTIAFYNVSKDTRHIINHNQPSEHLAEYMNAMVRLKEAIEYFQEHHPGSPEYSSANTLYQHGKRAIEQEFQHLLNQHSKPMTAMNIADMLGENDDEFGGIHEKMSPEVYMPLAAREQLQEVSRWLVENLTTTDFTTVYAQTRASVITRSLQGLIDHQKSSSGESLVSVSPSVITGFRGAKRSRKQLFSKSNKLLRKAVLKASETTQKKEEETFVMEMECYINCVSALLSFIEYESELMVSIIPNKQQRRVFDIALQPALDLIVSEGEKLGTTARKAAEHYNFKEVPTLFPVARHLRTVRPQFDVKLEWCQPVNRSKFVSLITSLDNEGNKILVLLIESIQKDPDKASNMPADGTVHELTRNTMSLLNTLKDYAEIIGAMLMVEDRMFGEQDDENSRIKAARYMTKVLSALGLNLKNKAETYQDTYLAAIFMLNNYNYIHLKLHSEGLLTLVHKYDPQVEAFYEGLIVEQKKRYFESFSRIKLYLVDDDRSVLPQRSSELTKLTDKEKQNIKDRFTGFNKELEDLCKTQKCYAIPDPKLRESIKRENKEFVVPKYGMLRDKYFKMNFTRNSEKYIKYTAHDVKDMLDKLFDVTS